jgi:hypothetical protein
VPQSRWPLLAAAVLAALPLLAATAVAAPPWLQYKFDGGHTGYYPASPGRAAGYYDGRVAFTAGLCIASNPVLYDVDGDGVDEAVFPSCDGYTYALKPSTGEVLWRARTGLGLASAALVEAPGGPLVVVPGPGRLYALRASDGSTAWVLRGEFYDTFPAVAAGECGGPFIVASSLDGRLYFITPQGGVAAVFNLTSSALNPPSVGDVDGDGCPDAVVLSRDGVLYAASPGGGVYSIRLGGSTLAVPAVVNGSIYAYSGGALYRVSYKQGGLRVDWSLELGGESRTSPSVGDVDGDGRVDVVVPTDEGLYIVSPGGALEYSFDGVDASYGGVVIADIDGDGRNEMVVARYDNELDIVDLAGGGGGYLESIEYIQETGGPLMAPPSIGDVDGDGMLEVVVGSRDFNLYIIDPEPAGATQPQGASAAASSTPTPPAAPAGGGRAAPGPAQPAPAGWAGAAYLALALAALAAAALAYRRRR